MVKSIGYNNIHVSICKHEQTEIFLNQIKNVHGVLW
jgi:hypothetical protein